MQIIPGDHRWWILFPWTAKFSSLDTNWIFLRVSLTSVSLWSHSLFIFLNFCCLPSLLLWITSLVRILSCKQSKPTWADLSRNVIYSLFWSSGKFRESYRTQNHKREDMKGMPTFRAIFKLIPKKQHGETIIKLDTGCHFWHYSPRSFRNLAVVPGLQLWPPPTWISYSPYFFALLLR